MNKLLSLVFIVCISIVGVAAAHAGGCGIGVHRGPYNGCSPVYGGYYNGYYDRYYNGYYDRYYNGYYDRYYDGYYGGYYEGYYEGYHDAYYGNYGPSRVVETGLCWGRGTHRVCNGFGSCWRVCN